MLALKDNQGTLHRAVQNDFHKGSDNQEVQSHAYLGLGKDRTKYRKYKVTKVAKLRMDTLLAKPNNNGANNLISYRE